MKQLLIVFTFGLSIMLVGCTKITINPTEDTEFPQETITEEPEIKVDMTDKKQVMEYTLSALKEENMDKLETVISKDGVRFSPYSYIDTKTHITLKKEDLKEAFEGTTQYVRGSEDGTGDPILLTFKNYLKKYVYDINFEKLSERNYDTIVQRGNTINNIEDIYSGASTVEFFIPGINPEYEGMDRRSLTLVLQQEDNQRKVKAIVHNQWTI
ncbi:spore germination protein-like protein [candidate division SR1 bacterium RAAC1_SR1_1]|nr:spore germination protein-like protein [candidate division SR1 bacterium RAAC1_SR1_1]